MKKKSVFVKESDLIALGVPKEQIEVLKKSPRLGYHPLRQVDLGSPVAIQEKQFYILGEEIGDTSPDSCLKDVLKKGDILVSINDAYFSVLSKTKVFLKNNQVFDKITDIVKDGEEVEISYLTEVRSEKSTDMRPMQGSVKHKEQKVTIKISFLYEVNDEKIIYKIEKARILALPKNIKSRLFNQDHAVDTVFKSIKTYFTGLKEDNKPLGGYLFVGPTGTGKTELATLYAKNLGFSFVRIDMSEYMEKHTVSRLIGSPAGYVGYGDHTILEKEIGNEGKKVVLLLDEMEKAHPDLQKIFLQALDNSRITLANGAEVNFSQTLIIMTSNLGTVTKTSMGLGSTGTETLLTVDMQQIKQYFVPEFMGRLSGVVQFNPLETCHAQTILDKFILEFNETKLSSKGAFAQLSQNAKDHLVKIGFDRMYGARPLKKALHGEIYSLIADLYLFEDEHKSKIAIDFDGTYFSAKFEDEVPEFKEESHSEPTKTGIGGFLGNFLKN